MKYMCTYCSVFAYDDEKGDPATRLEPGTKLKEFPEGWQCPVCGMDKSYLQEVREDVFALKMTAYIGNPDEKQDLNYFRAIAREMLPGFCGVYPVCDGKPGRTCVGQKYGDSIGIGGAGQGKTFEANYDALQKIKLKTRVIKAHHEPDMNLTIFGKELSAPVMGASISGVKESMNDAIPEAAFYRAMLRGPQAFGSIGLVGNTSTVPDDEGVKTVGENKGYGIPIFKPQSQKRLFELFHLGEDMDVIAMGVDLDGAGSTFWKTPEKQVFRKSEGDLKELVDCTDKPVIFKGIMSIEDALKVVDSGASACYVSNHGGRVLDGSQGVAEVLSDIAGAVAGKIKVMADGAVRTGFDVIKILALGADVALIGRPLAQAAIGGGELAVNMYLDYVKEDIRRAMVLTGCDNLNEVDESILVKNNPFS